MNKIYKFWQEGNKENYTYIAANSYNSAMRIFKKQNDINDLSAKGETLLKKNPSSSRDYLRLDIEEGIIPDNVEFEYFGGNKHKLKAVSPELKNFIRKVVKEEIHKEVQKYFEGGVPF